MKARHLILSVALCLIALAGLSLTPQTRPYARKAYCAVMGHAWQHQHTENWIWFYNFKGINAEHPDGYQYRFIPNAVLCRRCGTYLFDRSVVDDEALPIDPEIRSSVPAGTADSHQPWEVSSGPPFNQWPYRSGRLEGNGRDYYRSGQIRNEWVAHKDELSGPARGYHSNGKLQWEGSFVNGDPDGRFREYYENGVLKNEFNYRHGKLEGESRQYSPSGALWRIRHYRADMTDGAGTDYFEDGTVKREDLFKNGKLMTRVEHTAGSSL